MRCHRLKAVALAGLLTTGWSGAQQPVPSPAEPAKPYVLHVYANLVQVPALILSSEFHPVAPLTKDRIVISLDSGPAFHPVKMHIEGDEPISLAILLDASDRQDRLIPDIHPALAKLAQSSLNIQDSVSVYSVDCKLIRSGMFLPPDRLASAVEHGLDAPALHEGGKRRSCAQSLHLWDSIGTVLKSLGDLPGRRVLLIVSNGDDHKSSTKWNELREYADLKSITIFGLRDLMRVQASRGFSINPVVGAGVYSASAAGEDPYLQLCELTGGVALAVPKTELPESLQRILAMVRGRYILEFPRPDDNTPGSHNVEVTVPSLSAFVTTSGVTIALPDPSQKDDPNTVPTSASPAVMGKRRVLNSH
jgi:hypothetical protein